MHYYTVPTIQTHKPIDMSLNMTQVKFYLKMSLCDKRCVNNHIQSEIVIEMKTSITQLGFLMESNCPVVGF